MPKHNLRMLFVGELSRAEFSRTVNAVPRDVEMLFAASVAQAEARLAAGTTPDVVVVAQAYPGQFPGEQVERLRRLAPLAPVVGLLGSWCDGELRSGQPWSGAVRISWPQWPARAARELERLATGAPSTWSLPATATDEERLLLQADEATVPQPGLIVIQAGRSAMAEWLTLACRQQGYSVVSLQVAGPTIVQGAVAAISDVATLDSAAAEEVRRLARIVDPAPVVVLANFPRIEDVIRAANAGAAAVLAKPVPLTDLFWQLRLCGLMQTPRPSA